MTNETQVPSLDKRLMHTTLPSVLALSLCLHFIAEGRAQGPSSKVSQIPIYVTPFYNSKGPKIDVGPFSKELSTATADSIRDVTKKMKKEWATLRIETMYVTAIRLYDLGLKDDATYWFYSADYRDRLLRSIIPPDSLGSIGEPGFERIQAFAAFHQLAGKYINGYAFGNLLKLEEAIELVKSENEELPKFNVIYAEQKLTPVDSWPEKNKEIGAGLDKLLDYITNNADEISATRKKNGIEGKY